MTLPSKSTEASSPSNGFTSGGDSDDGPCPEDPIPPEGLLFDGRDEGRSPPEGEGVVRTCRVCGDNATGMYFGALVCVPCKTFFLRYAGEGFAYECKNERNCEVTTATRTQCKFCRYKKCLLVGMYRRVRPAQVEAKDGQLLCVVCYDVANGIHFGALTCEGCKKFFRRGQTEHKSYRCRGSRNCSINPSNRNACRYCRYQKCLDCGMSREAILMGRPSKMSIFEGTRNRPQSKDAAGDPTLRGPSGPSSDPGRGSGCPVPGRPTGPSKDGQNGTLSPSMEDRVKRAALFQAYGRVSTGKAPLVWDVPPGGLSPLPEAGPEEDGDGEDTGGSGDESGRYHPLLPVDFSSALPPRTLVVAPPSEWSGTDDDEDRIGGGYFRLDSGFREASPVRTLRPVKRELDSPDEEEEEEDLAAGKRIRYEGRAGPVQGFRGLPQGQSRPLVGTVSVVTRTKRPSTSSSSSFSFSEDAHSYPSELFETGQQHPRAFSSRVYYEDDLVSDGCSSSSGRPVEGQVGSTRRGNFFTGREFEDTCKTSDNDFPLDQSETDLTATVPDSVAECPLGIDPGLGTQMEEVGNQCWLTIKQVIPAYHSFVSTGTVINVQLKEAHEVWKRHNPRSDLADELSLWIQTTVVPAYTTVSIAYCRCLPDFRDLCAVDQRILIAGGQSQSRILAAAMHWYDAGEKRFRNFLSWRAEDAHRTDAFKGKLRQFAERVSMLRLDPVEAALLNAVGMFNAEYPNLQDRGAIEAIREKILTTMKSYIAVLASNGTIAERFKILWQVLREAQHLGAEHVALTNTRTLGLPSSGQKEGGAEELTPDDPRSPVGRLPSPEISQTTDDHGQQTSGGANHVTRSSAKPEAVVDRPPAVPEVVRAATEARRCYSGQQRMVNGGQWQGGCEAAVGGQMKLRRQFLSGSRLHSEEDFSNPYYRSVNVL